MKTLILVLVQAIDCVQSILSCADVFFYVRRFLKLTVELKPLKYFITQNVGLACKFSS